MNFGTEPAPAPSECLLRLTPFFLAAPAAQGWARTIVLSMMPFSMSGSLLKYANMRSQTPCSHHRANRLYTLFHFPYSAGNSRHCAPLRLIHLIASMNRRQPCSSLPMYACRSCSRNVRIFVHSASFSFTSLIPLFYAYLSFVNRT